MSARAPRPPADRDRLPPPLRRGPVVLLGLAGSLAGLAIATRPIVNVRGGQGLGAARELGRTGAELAPAYPAALTAAAAACLALLFVGRRLRPVVAAVLLACAVGAEVAWRVALADPGSALRVAGPGAGSAVAQVAGLAYAGDVAAVLVAAAGVLALLGWRRWAAPSAAYDAPAPATERSAAEPAGGARPTGAEDRADAWAALDRGEDPTL